MASFWARLSIPGGDPGGAGVRYIGKQWADDANTRAAAVGHADGRHDAADLRRLVAGAEEALMCRSHANNIGNRADTFPAADGTGNCYWEQSAKRH